MLDIVRQAEVAAGNADRRRTSMEKLASYLGLSKTHFHRVFKEHTGLSPYEYHQQLRIERAKQMLHGSNMSVKKIAASLAFASPYHFWQVFRAGPGCRPASGGNTGVAPMTVEWPSESIPPAGVSNRLQHAGISAEMNSNSPLNTAR